MSPLVVGLMGGLLGAVVIGAAAFLYVRWRMNKLMRMWWEDSFADMVVIVARLWRPQLAALGLVWAQVSVIFGYVAILADGATPPYAALGEYTVEDVTAISESLHRVLVRTLAAFRFTGLTANEIALFLDAVCEQLGTLMPAPAPAP